MRKQFDKKHPKEIRIIPHLKVLFSRMIKEFPNLLLAPFEQGSTENMLTHDVDIPDEEEKLKIYVQGARVTYGNCLVMNFKILSPVSFITMTKNSNFSNFMKKQNYFLNHHNLDSYDTVKVGGLINSHNQFTRRDDASKEVEARMNDGHDDKIKIQLLPYLYVIRDEEKISTRTLAIEVAKCDVETAKDRLMDAFNTSSTKWEGTNTGAYRFFPFKASNDIPAGAIKQFAQAQNKFLHSTTGLAIYNLSNTDWKIPGKDISFKKYLLQAKHPNTGDRLIYAAERSMEENKFFLLVKQDYHNYVRDWIDGMATAIEAQLDSNWKSLTGCDGKIRTTFRERNPSHAKFTHNLLQELNPQSGDEGVISPPPVKKRNQRRFITFEKPTYPAWKNPHQNFGTKEKLTPNFIDMSQEYGTPQKKSSQETRNPNHQHKNEQKLDSLEEKLAQMNRQMDEQLSKVKSANIETKHLVCSMIENNSKIMADNKSRDDRIDEIEKGMLSNATKIQGEEMDKSSNMAKITKNLTNLYNNNNDKMAKYEDCEYSESTTLDELVVLTSTYDKENSNKRKIITSTDDSDISDAELSEMEEEEESTNPAPANNNSLIGAGAL